MRKTILKLKRLMNSRKAVSPVIAVILLIAIAVAASVTVFAYTQGILTGVTQANLVMSNAQIINSQTISVTIQNTGGTSTNIEAIDIAGGGYGTHRITNALTGELYDTDGNSGTDTDILIGAGDSVTIGIGRTSGTWSSGDTVTIELFVDGNGPSGTPDYEATFVL